MNNTTHGPSTRGLSFRFKLALVMVLMIAGIAGTVLYFTQQSINQQYQSFLDSQFEQQNLLFKQTREQRLSFAQDTIYAATTNIRLIAAITVGEWEQFLSDMKFELRNVIRSYEQKSQRAAEGYVPFFRFIKANGEVLEDHLNNYGGIPGLEEKELDAAIAILALGSQENVVESGYLDFPSPDGPALYEILVAPIIDKYDTGDYLGVLVFGIPVDVQTSQSTNIRGGLYLRNRLFASGLSEEARRILELRLNELMDVGRAMEKTIELEAAPFSLDFRKLPLPPRFPQVYQLTLLPLDDLLQLRAGVRQVVGTFLIVGIVIAIGLSVVVSGQLTKRISALVKVVKDVQRGNYVTRAKVEGSDEITVLTHNVNEMTAGLALKEKYRSVLDKVTDKDVAEAILQGKLELGGENLVATVMFCDIRGFTSLTANMPPGEVIEMLNEHMTALTGVIYKHKGVVDKFIGDAIMVLFGAPKSYGNDALNGCRAAMEIIEVREKLNQTSKFFIRLGIGLATGEVVAGKMGSQDRLNYTVLGKNVNLAARLCSSAGPMEIVVCPETKQHVGNEFILANKGELSLKGFQEPVSAYLLHRSPQHPPLSGTPFSTAHTTIPFPKSL